MGCGVSARLSPEARAACERIGRDPAAVAANIDTHLRAAPSRVEFHVAEVPTTAYRFRDAPPRADATVRTIRLVRREGGSLWVLAGVIP